MQLIAYRVQVISILLEKYSLPELAEKIVFIAGHKVTNDPVAIPFSMVRHWDSCHMLPYSIRDSSESPMSRINVHFFSLCDFICFMISFQFPDLTFSHSISYLFLRVAISCAFIPRNTSKIPQKSSQRNQRKISPQWRWANSLRGIC